MSSKAPHYICINLPVAALDASITFYTAIGFTKNPKFSDPTCMMMVFSPAIQVMLLTPACFANFLPAGQPITDATTSTQVLFCLSAHSRTAVDDMIDKAAAAGGTADIAPKQVMGDMIYARSFADLDGHIWKMVWMDDRPENCPTGMKGND